MKRLSAISKRVNELLPIYFTCLDHESAAAGSHQNILLSLQVGLLGIQYLSRDDMSNFWILAVVGISLCFLIAPLYEYRVNNVDFWRVEILYLIKGTPFEKTFHQGGYGSYVFGNRGKNHLLPISHWFTVICIPLVIFAWFVGLMFNPPNIPVFPQIGASQWLLWLLLFLCEAIWIAILIYLRRKQGRNHSI